jgi:hypothetical protein
VAADPKLLAAGLISGVAVGPVFGASDKDDAVAAVDENVGASDGLNILAGTSPETLAEEAAANAQAWSLEAYAPALAGRPLLLITSDDGFRAGSDALARAAGHSGLCRVRLAHFTTDHSYSDHRIALQIEVLNWLGTVLAKETPLGSRCETVGRRDA